MIVLLNRLRFPRISNIRFEPDARLTSNFSDGWRVSSEFGIKYSQLLPQCLKFDISKYQCIKFDISKYRSSLKFNIWKYTPGLTPSLVSAHSGYFAVKARKQSFCLKRGFKKGEKNPSQYIANTSPPMR